jgi:alkylated DNA repair dioxygenase AlkB
MADIPDRLIVTEYEPGHGIAAHVDCIPCFGAIVYSLTLASHRTAVDATVDAGTIGSIFVNY